MDLLFPHHPCVLARESNPFRCSYFEEVCKARCSVCREGARDEAWFALYHGDRSFAEFVLAEDSLIQAGFSIGNYQGEDDRDAVFGIVKTKTTSFTEPGDCAITPMKNGGYHFYLALDNETFIDQDLSDLTQVWLFARRFTCC